MSDADVAFIRQLIAEHPTASRRALSKKLCEAWNWVQPNSGLGQAISYLLKHWEKLTLFLRAAGAPLDNNICERALKKASLHRKNALFYKTVSGAQVGDLFMSVIHTCQFCGANPFDYLSELQRHAEEMSESPEVWMPWNYRERLKPADTPRSVAR